MEFSILNMEGVVWLVGVFLQELFLREPLLFCRQFRKKYLASGTKVLILLLYCREFGRSMSNSSSEEVSLIYWDKLFLSSQE